MDVLRPSLIRIGGRCYRKNPTRHSSGQGTEDIGAYREEDEYPEEARPWLEESCALDTADIQQTDRGYSTTLQVPNEFFKFIIGRKGETKRQIENETRTIIRIPRQGQEGDIVIEGKKKCEVLSAKSRIEIKVDTARQKQPFTHFLSFPCNGSSIGDSFEDFKSDVLRELGGDRGVDRSIFQNPYKLHLTLGTLVLLNQDEIERANQMLQQCNTDLVEPILQGNPLTVDIEGLEYMNDDPCNVDVLYAKVQPHDGTDKLQILADRLVDKFVSTGLMQRQYDRVKLHITVMNTLFRKDPNAATEPSDGRSRNQRHERDRESFDASNILKTYGEHNFGVYTIDSLDISQRYTTADDGYYDHVGKIRIS
ncbi:unnamed protein product [Owenia fusiformis]|uniref:Uncharacterized protein n=1 Tax=Owenia fusiformis TaxID=6347 RepID=A0A8J1UBQ8_OWEFU|nr:unnamed protein product [Owenia fusiformis]